jgi:hypothetical protein
LAGHDSNGIARFVALIFAPRDGASLSLAPAQQTDYQSDFLEFPRPHCGVWSDKMALLLVSVNLWKTLEVS